MNKLFIILILLFILANFSFALSISQLIDKAPNYDGRVVIIAGEVVGDVMNRGDHAWVTMSDGEKAIGIWMKKALAQEIQFKGDYKKLGDQIQVRGIFYQAGIKHGGDLYIDAEEMQITSSGKKITHQINQDRILAAIILGIATLVLIGLRVLLKR